MEFTNIRDNEEFKFCIDDGMEIIEGHPQFNKVWSEPINAKAFAQELIKHTYRNGWSLPEMPS